MIATAIVLLALTAGVVWLFVKGAGRNRQGIKDYKFGYSGISRFGTYDSPLYPTNREARRAEGWANDGHRGEIFPERHS